MARQDPAPATAWTSQPAGLSSLLIPAMRPTSSWHFPHPLLPPRSIPAVPKQDNHWDCGLFLCAYVEFFTFK